MKGIGLGIALALLIAGCSSNKDLTKKEQDKVDVYTDLGLAYLKRGDLARARDPLLKALELDPSSAKAHHYAAEFYNRLEDEKTAEHHFREALELTPDDPFLLNNFGAFLCAQKRIEEAETMFLKVLKVPGYKEPQAVYENLAQCALRIPDAAKAEKYFRSALKLQPDRPKSLYNMARLHYDKRDFWRARAYLERYLSVGKPTPAVLLLAVQIERELDSPDLVAKYSEMLRTQFSDSPEVARLAEMEAEDAQKRKEQKGKPIEVIVSEEVAPPAKAPPPPADSTDMTAPEEELNTTFPADPATPIPEVQP